MNNTRKIPLESRVSQKNPQNTTGLGGNDVTSPNKPLLSRIKANFGRNCQNKLNFAARVSFLTAQKNQKTAACTTSRGFIVLKKGACKNV
jgi:hypothetical protein